MDKTDKELSKSMRPKKKRKFNKKYTKGSSNAKRRKELMGEIATIYETEKQPYSAAVKKRLDRLMKERDKI